MNAGSAHAYLVFGGGGRIYMASNAMGVSLDVLLSFQPGNCAINLVIDSSGLSIFGEGQWAAVKHGGKGIQGWRKLHLGVDETGIVVVQTFTNSNVDDAVTGTKLTATVNPKIKTVRGDRMRARGEEAQRVEAVIACGILDRMTELGRPKSDAIGR